jgi:hypothetical protein
MQQLKCGFLNSVFFPSLTREQSPTVGFLHKAHYVLNRVDSIVHILQPEIIVSCKWRAVRQMETLRLTT